MKSKKLVSLLLAVAMMLSLAVTANAEDVLVTTKGDMDGDIVILHTNDVHGGIAGYAKVAALKEAYEAEGAYVLLLDAGDFLQGDPVVNVSDGATAVELMNMAGYDAVTTGNHEYDFGYDNLAALSKVAEFPILAANVLYQGKVAFDDNMTFTAPDGTKVGLFGLATPESATKANPANIKGVTFLAEKSLFDCAQAQVDALEAEGCDYIIGLSHLGIDAESTGNRSTDLLEEVEGIDVLIDGHSHSTLADMEKVADEVTTVKVGDKEVVTSNGKIGDTYITSTGTKLENVGVVTIGAKGDITVKSVSTEGLVSSNKEIADRAAAIQKDIDDTYGAVFAKTEVELNGAKAPGNRTEETNLGDLITDALVWGARQNGLKVDAALTNGGGIRATVKKGDITRKDILTVLPFGNTLATVEIKGSELLEALEASVFCLPDAAGGFPQVSGIVYTVDASKPFDQGAQYPGSTYHAPKTIQRVTIQSIGGKAFDPKATYNIVTNNFSASGGDTYYAFTTADKVVDTGIVMDEVVSDFIETELKGVVSAEDYGAPAGRITIKLGLPFTDVARSAAYYDAVKYCFDNKIFLGVTDTTFAPDNTLTRGQMVTVLWRMNGSPEPKAANPFGDVAATSPFVKAIAWAAENGLTDGYTPTTFRPGQAISRQQFLTILHRYAKFMDYDVTATADLTTFADGSGVGEYAVPAMQWAVGAGVASAIDGKLMPTDPAPRYQVAGFLANFCQKVVPVETAAAA